MQKLAFELKLPRQNEKKLKGNRPCLDKCHHQITKSKEYIIKKLVGGIEIEDKDLTGNNKH